MDTNMGWWCEASRVSVPDWIREDGSAGTGSARAVLGLGEEDAQRGDDFAALVGETLRQATLARTVRALGHLVAMYGDRVLWQPEVHEFLDWLIRRGEEDAVHRILGDVKRRGRPHESQLYVVALTRHVARVWNISAAKAAEWVARKFGKYCKSARAIENDVSRYGRHLDLFDGCRAYRPGTITRTTWTPPWG